MFLTVTTQHLSAVPEWKEPNGETYSTPYADIESVQFACGSDAFILGVLQDLVYRFVVACDTP
jgi:hypothetical protein